jgi:hypothetical protein
MKDEDDFLRNGIGLYPDAWQTVRAFEDLIKREAITVLQAQLVRIRQTFGVPFDLDNAKVWVEREQETYLEIGFGYGQNDYIGVGLVWSEESNAPAVHIYADLYCPSERFADEVLRKCKNTDFEKDKWDYWYVIAYYPLATTTIASLQKGFGKAAKALADVGTSYSAAKRAVRS